MDKETEIQAWLNLGIAVDHLTDVAKYPPDSEPRRILEEIGNQALDIGLSALIFDQIEDPRVKQALIQAKLIGQRNLTPEELAYAKHEQLIR